ncbi:MAG: glucoamylase family protein [Omnitrophica WOR_2 bacterium]
MQRELLDDLQKRSFQYFIDQANPKNGLVADSIWKNSPSSIAAVGFSLPVYAVGVEHGWLKREEAVERTLTILRFFSNGNQTYEPGKHGYQGFYYHFLNMETGERVWQCELSTIDTAILIAGMLATGVYYQENSAGEIEIRQRVDQLYERVNWPWALDEGKTLSHGWKPEAGFLPYRWEGYDEALLLYILGLGSPTYPLSPSSYHAWTSTFRWETLYDIPFLFAGPLFIHHFSHIWIDFREIQDQYMNAHSSNYFENSRKAAYINRQYALQNPHQFYGYGENAWGITASEGPIRGAGPVDMDGHRYYGYMARGVPEPDDGTLSPWTVITSLPFAPEIALPSIEHYLTQYPHLYGKYGMMCSLNLTFPTEMDGQQGWYSNNYYGLNEGPVVLMIENYLNGFIWKLMKQQPSIHIGLKRAGFKGGWL